MFSTIIYPSCWSMIPSITINFSIRLAYLTIIIAWFITTIWEWQILPPWIMFSSILYSTWWGMMSSATINFNTRCTLITIIITCFIIIIWWWQILPSWIMFASIIYPPFRRMKSFIAIFNEFRWTNRFSIFGYFILNYTFSFGCLLLIDIFFCFLFWIFFYIVFRQKLSCFIKLLINLHTTLWRMHYFLFRISLHICI